MPLLFERDRGALFAWGDGAGLAQLVLGGTLPFARGSRCRWSATVLVTTGKVPQLELRRVARLAREPES